MLKHHYFALNSLIHAINEPSGNYTKKYIVNDDLHIIHPISGGGTIEISNIRYPIDFQTVYYISPLTPYYVMPSNRHGLTMLNIHYTGSYLENNEALSLPDSFKPNELNQIHKNLHQAKNLLANNTSSNKAKAILSLNELVWSYYQLFGEKQKFQCANSKINMLCQMLADKSFVKFSAKECADHINLSISQMNRIFHSEFNKSPQIYWDEIRFERSCKLLLNNSLSISQIGELLGFSDQNYFARWFKKNSRMTPNQYRKQNKNGPEY